MALTTEKSRIMSTEQHTTCEETYQPYVVGYQPPQVPMTIGPPAEVFESPLDVFQSASTELRSLTADFGFSPAYGDNTHRQEQAPAFVFNHADLRPDSPYSDGENMTSSSEMFPNNFKNHKPRGRRVATAETLDCSVFTSGKKLFICNEQSCGKVFKRAEHLSRHHRMHSGERPYPCQECERSFSRSDNLSAHMSRVLHLLLIQPGAQGSKFDRKAFCFTKKFKCHVCYVRRDNDSCAHA
jgi:hypothetical protein